MLTYMGIQFKMDISWYHNTDDKGKQRTEIKSPDVMKGHHSAISSYKKKKKKKMNQQVYRWFCSILIKLCEPPFMDGEEWCGY